MGYLDQGIAAKLVAVYCLHLPQNKVVFRLSNNGGAAVYGFRGRARAQLVSCLCLSFSHVPILHCLACEGQRDPSLG